MTRCLPIFVAAILATSTCLAEVTYPYWVPFSPPVGSSRTHVKIADLAVESVDAVTYSPNGTLYAISNDLGRGSLYRIDSSTPSHSSSLIGAPHGLTYGPDGMIYATSTDAYGPVAGVGVLQYNPSTLQYVKTAISLTTADAPSDVVFGPGGKMYVATANGVKRYGGSPLTKEVSYNVPNSLVTSIGFRPGSTDLFLVGGTNDRIDEYNINGGFVKTFIAAGTNGMGTICDFVFGDDGTIYLTDRVTIFQPSFSMTNHLLTFDSSGNFLSSSTISSQGGFTPIAVFPSAEFVPEPVSLAMLAAGIPLLLRRRK